MKFKQIGITISAFSLLSISSLAQVVNVDPYTGSGSVNIPLWTVTTKDLAHPIALRYSARGIPSSASSGNFGTGWFLQAESSIRRQVKDLPDDYLKDNSSPKKYGWLHNNVAQYINSIIPLTAAPDTTSLVYDALNQFGGFNGSAVMKDTEPDLFFINVPGLSASFIFDHDGNIAFTKPTNVLLENTSPDSIDNITSFKLTIENGTKYYFEANIPSSIYTHVDDSNPYTTDTDDHIKYFKRKYNLFKEGVSYIASWRLISIVSKYGDEINFDYDEITPAPTFLAGNVVALDKYTSQDDTLNVYVYNELTDDYDKIYQYNIKTSSPPYDYQLNSISTKTQRVEFLVKDIIIPEGQYKLKKSLIGGIDVIDKETNSLIKKYSFDYATLGKDDDEDGEVDGLYSHIFLKSVTEHSELTAFAPYSFEYFGFNIESEVLQMHRESKEHDIYGFGNATINSGKQKLYVYNELTGRDKIRLNPIANYSGKLMELGGKMDSAPNLSLLLIGSLKKITIPSGGTNTIIYEPNLYFDSLSQTNIYGGGLRVKQLEVFDGVDHDNDIITRYGYNNDLGNSSGKLLYQPVFAFQSPVYYNNQADSMVYYDQMTTAGLTEEEIFKRTLIRTDWDITREENSGAGVAYEKTTIFTNGIGKTVYEFDIKTDHRSTTTANGPLALTKGAIDFLDSSYHRNFYPLLPISDLYELPGVRQPFDLRNNGNLLEISVYNENQKLVSKTINEYSNIGLEKNIYGLKMFKQSARASYRINFGSIASDTLLNNSGYLLFKEYLLKIGSNSIIKNTEQRSYDPSENGNYISSNISYDYDTTGHYSLIKKTVSNSENTAYTHYKYAKDYIVDTTNSTLDSYSWAIFNLKANNEIGSPIEVISTRIINGVEKVMGAALTLPNYTYGLELERPIKSETYSLNKPVDYASFIKSSITNTAGNYTFNYDNSNYIKVSSVDKFDSNGNPISITDRNQNKQGVHYDNNGQKTKLVINGAIADEVLYSNFESIGMHDFFHENGTYSTGRSESKGIQITAGAANKIYGLVKNDNYQSYIISCWIKSASNGIANINLTDESNNSSTGTLAYSNTSNDWIYYESILPAGNLGDSINVEFYTNTTINIDEIIFYPEISSISYQSYGKNGVKISETDSRGNSVYYEYDDLHRIRYIKDSEHNIVKKSSYSQYGDKAIWEPKIIWSSNYVNKTIKFTASPDIDSDATYKWNIISKSGNDSISSATDLANVRNFNNSTSYSQNTIEFKPSDLDYPFDSIGSWFVNVQITYNNETKDLKYIRGYKTRYEPIVLTLRANRPSLIDLCNPETEIPKSGFYATSNSNSVCITAEVSGGSGNYEFSWRKISLNSAVENTSLPYTTSKICDTNYYGRRYICEATDLDSNAKSKAISIDFMVYQSDPDCPPIDPTN